MNEVANEAYFDAVFTADGEAEAMLNIANAKKRTARNAVQVDGGE